jgi:death on curing protein
MKEPEFLTLAKVIRIHARGLEDHGGQDGIRDEPSLESPVNHPKNVWFYEGDLFEVAAAYAYHIAESQAFFDGNKRAGMGAALLFLDGNGFRINAPATRLHQAMIAIAKHELDRRGLADLFRGLATPL